MEVYSTWVDSMVLREFSTLNASGILYLLQSLALSKKRYSIIKVKHIPSSQHTTTPLHCCFLKHQQGRNQHHTSTKLFLHTLTFLCSALPIQLTFSKGKQLEGCRMKDS